VNKLSTIIYEYRFARAWQGLTNQLPAKHKSRGRALTRCLAARRELLNEMLRVRLMLC